MNSATQIPEWDNVAEAAADKFALVFIETLKNTLRLEALFPHRRRTTWFICYIKQ